MNGQTLHCKRLSLDLTQKELASDLCVSIGAVSLWESGKRKIPLSIEKLFCLIYGFEFEKSDIYNDNNQPFLFDLN